LARAGLDREADTANDRRGTERLADVEQLDRRCFFHRLASANAAAARGAVKRTPSAPDTASAAKPSHGVSVRGATATQKSRFVAPAASDTATKCSSSSNPTAPTTARRPSAPVTR